MEKRIPSASKMKVYAPYCLTTIYVYIQYIHVYMFRVSPSQRHTSDIESSNAEESADDDQFISESANNSLEDVVEIHAWS